MSKKSKDNKKKKKALNLKNIALGLSSLLLISFLFFQIKSVVGNVISKESIDHTVNTVLSDLFPDISAPPPLPPPPPPPFAVCGDLLYDQDGHSYKTMEIAGQCWMAENLNTGVMLDSASTMPKPNNIIEKWCYSDDLSICEAEGGLYSWDEAMQGSSTEGAQGICPPGWHIPTNDEWNTIGSLRTSDLNKFKAFFPLFPGSRGTNGSFSGRSSFQNLWSSSEALTTNARGRYLSSSYSYFNDSNYNKEYGFSVRCLMD